MFEEGRFIKGKNISLKYINGGSDKIEFGMVVSQKKIPLAVNRNLIRRRIKFLIRQKSFIDTKRIPIGFYLLIYSNKAHQSLRSTKSGSNLFIFPWSV